MLCFFKRTYQKKLENIGCFSSIKVLIFLRAEDMDSYKELKVAGSLPDKTSQVSGKKVLHFSDGILELNDCENNHLEHLEQITVDPHKLSWAPWLWYYTIFAGSKALQICDSVGESLAMFFGITTPKYQYEISEYERLKREEEQNRPEKYFEGSWPDHTHMAEKTIVEPQQTNAEEFELWSIKTGESESKT